MWHNLSFEYPWMFALLLPLLVGLIWHYRKPSPTLQIPWIKPFQKVQKHGDVNYKTWIPFLLESLAGLCLVLALTGPQIGAGEIKQKSKGVDILIAIDLSGSMQIYDLPRGKMNQSQIQMQVKQGKIKQRIDVCKDEVRRFISMRPNDRIGLIAFADRAYAICPPTADHAWLNEQINRLKLNSIGDGTGIAAPIAATITRLKDTDAKRKVLVLFTDGDNTVANKITPMQAAALANKYHITVHTVGIGGKVSVTQSPFHGQFHPVNATYDEKLLRKIAEKTQGKFYGVDDAEAMREALAEIDKLEPKTEESPAIILYDSAVAECAGIAILCLLLAFFLRRTIFLRYP